ncbi:hypothetical protein [Halalkalicoccus tibetensis]|uniref:ABC transporter permease n=1 Tax=Halalkalicoccus tibetensis TaxID=175632 RepID=A0ABD5V0X8_9EURY
MDSTRFDHPAFRAAAGTLAGYGIVLVVMTVLLFLIPYAVFAAF